jgi:hypothetical protein
MLFPDTWKEFEKHYGFHDIKQAYTFGNTRLIPSFRVQQWLDHLDDVKCKKQLQKNKMEQVAALFGKKLNERFTVRYDGNHLFDCKFTECGLISYGAYDNPWLDFDTFMLQDLLVGRAVIVDDKA